MEFVRITDIPKRCKDLYLYRQLGDQIRLRSLPKDQMQNLLWWSSLREDFYGLLCSNRQFLQRFDNAVPFGDVRMVHWEFGLCTGIPQC